MSREIHNIEATPIALSPAPAGVGILLFWSDGSLSAANLRRSISGLLKDSNLKGSRDGYAKLESWALIPELSNEP